jgi:hypothetical protein
MPKRSSKDPNVTAFNTLNQFLAKNDTPSAGPKLSASLDNAELRRQLMQEMGRRGGKKGGKARAANLSKKERSEIARNAAKARWDVRGGKVKK